MTMLNNINCVCLNVIIMTQHRLPERACCVASFGQMAASWWRLSWISSVWRGRRSPCLFPPSGMHSKYAALSHQTPPYASRRATAPTMPERAEFGFSARNCGSFRPGAQTLASTPALSGNIKLFKNIALKM